MIYRLVSGRTTLFITFILAVLELIERGGSTRGHLRRVETKAERRPVLYAPYKVIYVKQAASISFYSYVNWPYMAAE